MIEFHDGTFYAPANATYADRLKAACWKFDGERFFTEDIANFTEVAEFSSPALSALLLGTKSDYESSVALKPSENFTVPLPDGREMFAYQIADVEYIVGRHSTLLAEEAGLGKTAIMIGVANLLGVKNMLIICPAIAKYNWVNELGKWSTLPKLSIGVVESNDYPDTDIVIINYDILDRHKKVLQEKVWDYVVVDESHRIKNEEANRTKMVLGGTLKVREDVANKMGLLPSRRKGYYKVEPLRAKKRVFASATPMNKPADLWTMAQACDPTGLGANWKTFHYRYCGLIKTPFGWKKDGADRLQELGALMRARFMVRHKPEDVLDLPPLREEIFLLPPVKVVLDEEEGFVHNNIDALLGLSSACGAGLTEESTSQDFLRLIGDAIIDNVPLIGKPEFMPLFSKFAIIRKETGKAKVPHIADFVKEVSEDGTVPVVVFGYHREVLEALREEFPGCAFVIGGLGAKARSNEVARFQDGGTNIFIGNFDAAGEAITLTRSHIMVIAEPDWRGTAMLQTRKRIHRISQEHACTVYYLASAKSFDALVASKGFHCMKNISETLDL